MSRNIPLDIQTEIMKRLPVIPLIRFRSVSKQWKSLIDSSEFVKDHSQYQHRLLARHKLESDGGLECELISIIDNENDDVFPIQESSLTLPLLLSSFMYIEMFNSVNGFLCFHGYIDPSGTSFAVFWNPTVGKSVSIRNPGLWSNDSISFGFCPDTHDPKLVRINIVPFTHRCEVDVFTLSSRVWKRVFMGDKPVYDCCRLTRGHVCIKGCIYWRALDYSTNVIVSFDLKSEMFGKVCLPNMLSLTHKWGLLEVNESLGVLEYDGDGGSRVWIMESITKSFTKMFTIKVPDQFLYNGILEVRKIGDNTYRIED